MYRFDEIGSLFASLPPNMQTVENDCIGYAVDRQLAKMHRLAKALTVWSDIDSASPRYYDQMAMTIRAPYYKSDYDDDLKCGLIKTAVMTRRFAGSRKAVEELLDRTFDYAVFVPWYEYGDSPYYFKIITGELMTPVIDSMFSTMLSQVMAVRSHIRAIETTRRTELTYYMAAVQFQVSVPPAIIDGYRAKETSSAVTGTGGEFRQIYFMPAVIDGYTTGESVSITFDAAAAALINMNQKPPAITEASAI